MTQTLWGLLAMTAAATVWGLSGLYYKALDHVPALEVVCHRIVWSAVFFGLILAARKRLKDLRVYRNRPGTTGPLCLAALTISFNWFLFIYAIQVGRALEASLGYYCFPLLAVALGYLVFGERFTRAQAVAFGLASFAVLVLTVGLGAPPWIALVLAASFGFYGVLKKRISIDPMVSVFAETLILAPWVLAYLIWLGAAPGAQGGGSGASAGAFGADLATTLLLMGSGPITATPLILMSYAAQHVRYATIGLVQYLNPTLQFSVAVAVFGEPFTVPHMIAFALIWTALAIYVASGLRQQRAARNAPSNSETLEVGVSVAKNASSMKP
ncbi:MAG: EamA family transporter RarD [Pseudomonadota bacterium]